MIQVLYKQFFMKKTNSGNKVTVYFLNLRLLSKYCE